MIKPTKIYINDSLLMNNEMIVQISKGQQVTIPASIRNKLKLGAGNKVEIELHGKEIVITPLKDDLKEIFKKARKTKPRLNLSIEEMEDIAEQKED